MKSDSSSKLIEPFIRIPRALFARLKEETLIIQEFVVLSVLLEQVSYDSGVWHGDAAKIVSALNGQLKERSVQTYLKSLAEKKLIKSFHIQGSKRPYYIALHGYEVGKGTLKGWFLDALATENPKSPVYLKSSPQCSDSDERFDERKQDNSTSPQYSDREDSQAAPSADHHRSVTAASPQYTAANTQEDQEDKKSRIVAAVVEEKEREGKESGQVKSVFVSPSLATAPDGQKESAIRKPDEEFESECISVLRRVYELDYHLRAFDPVEAKYLPMAASFVRDEGPDVAATAFGVFLLDDKIHWHNKEVRSAPLFFDFFMTGQCKSYAARVRPFVARCYSNLDLIKFLLDESGEPPKDFTDTEIMLLNGIMTKRRHTHRDLNRDVAKFWEKNDYRDDIAGFLRGYIQQDRLSNQAVGT